MTEKWDRRFLELAKHIAQWSKDPSTKTGAVIVNKDNRIISTGFNGFPQGILDSEERYNDRELKYQMIIHGDLNAILFARQDLTGYTLYTWPFMSCSKCASLVIQSGIARCVAPKTPEDIDSRWHDSLELSKQLFKEAGIKLDIYE
ncbi:MAG: deaminase [Nanoarchaeota archaeon]